MTDPKRILVTGDYGYDYDIYLPTNEDNPPPGTPPAQIGVSLGGAGIAHRILSAAAQQAARTDEGTFKLEVGFAGKPDRFMSPPTAALWQKFPFGKLGKTPDDERTDVWRVRRSLSLGAVAGSQPLPTTDLPGPVREDFEPTVVLVEDNVGGFRFQVPDWLQPLTEDGSGPLPEWIVLKTSAPVCHGAFWWALSGPSALRDRLAVVVSIRDLRTCEVRVSRGISWERTAMDLARELCQSPLLEGLRRAKHVIITLHGEGAMWMERVQAADGAARHRFTLLFDPGYMEGEWSREFCGAEGDAYGFQSTFASALAVHLSRAGSEGISAGIRSGLSAMRLLRAMGHGVAREPAPALPTEALATVILAGEAPAPKDLPRAPRADWGRLGGLGRAVVPPHESADGAAPSETAGGGACGAAETWRILETSDGRPSREQPLYGLGRRVALLGLEGLRNVPYASYGKLFTADRDEIEALRNIQQLMQEYERNASETKPLSIAVFGPPGAGKSFGIKQIADCVLHGKKSFLEFNLSQFKDVSDLIGAFHQVRDKVLEGGLPIVFWDEFDSQNYRWLQYLLAPMQDGKFQEGQITHPIGRCIFVFAGATSYDMDNFGPPERPWSQKDEVVKEHKEAAADFRLKKGPDFKSRLHGNLNVLGPNPRQCFHASNPPGEQWQDDPRDVCFPVRRAILLRSWLGMMTPGKKQSRERLNMDSGLLAALLEVGHYCHGSRSMEKIVMPVKQAGKGNYHRSALPSDEVLEMNVREVDLFMEIIDQHRAFQQHAWRLAPAIHAAWFPLADQKNAYKTDFAKLPEEAKGDNFAAAVRIPVILGLVGLQLVDEKDARHAVSEAELKSILENHLELLSEEEHKGWMEIKLANGWSRCAPPRTQDEQKGQRARWLNHCLVPYAELAEQDKDKDRASIRNYPAVARLAGFKIVPILRAPVRIG